jgi:hypothetical protein
MEPCATGDAFASAFGTTGFVFSAGLFSSAETANARLNATSDNHPTTCDERFMFGAFP